MVKNLTEGYSRMDSEPNFSTLAQTIENKLEHKAEVIPIWKKKSFATYCRKYGCQLERMWVTLKMVMCPVCSCGYSRVHFKDLSAQVEALHPVVHCNNWRPGDPEDKCHSPKCFKDHQA